jgi:hypothetical protein
MVEVIKAMNELRAKGLIKDWALGGGTAFNFYAEPRYTVDVDIYVTVKGNTELTEVYRYLEKKGYKWEQLYIVIDEIPVNLFPANIHPLIEEAIRCAKMVQIYNQPIKIFTIEYLIATFLLAFRQKDKERILELINDADRKCLDRILGRYKDEKYPLRARLREILKRV